MGAKFLALGVVGILLVCVPPRVYGQESSTTTVTVFVAACTDGVDNDGDLLIDYPSDLGCNNPGDTDETDPVYVCSDALDNDGDGKTDYPDDPGCDNATDQTEENIEPTSLSAGGGTIVGLIGFVNSLFEEEPLVNPALPTPALPLYTPDVAISIDPGTVFLGESTGLTGPTRSYFGQIRDEDGLVLEGVLVQLFARLSDGTHVPIQSAQGGLLAGTTNTDGFFKLDPVPGGEYILVASRVGYTDVSLDVSRVTERLALVLKRNAIEKAVCLLPLSGAFCAEGIPWAGSSYKDPPSLREASSSDWILLALIVSLLIISLGILVRRI